MTSHDTDGGSFEELKLQPLTPDPGRADRVRMRCRATLGRSRTRQAHTDAIKGLARQVLAPLVVGGFCVLYIAALVITTLRLFH